MLKTGAPGNRRISAEKPGELADGNTKSLQILQKAALETTSKSSSTAENKPPSSSSTSSSASTAAGSSVTTSSTPSTATRIAPKKSLILRHATDALPKVGAPAQPASADRERELPPTQPWSSSSQESDCETFSIPRTLKREGATFFTQRDSNDSISCTSSQEMSQANSIDEKSSSSMDELELAKQDEFSRRLSELVCLFSELCPLPDTLGTMASTITIRCSSTVRA